MMIPLTFRVLRRSPWFALTSVGTIALTISVAATVFAVVDGVLFKPLPHPDAAQLVLVSRASDQSNRSPGQPFSAADLQRWRERDGNAAIASFIANYGIGPLAIDAIGSETTWVARVDKMFFDVLQTRPLIGGFRDEHYRHPFEPGRLSAHPAIISYRLWKRLGAAPGGLPRELLQAGDGTLEIVGVLPPDFVFPAAFARTTPEVLLPLDVAPSQRGLLGVARLRPGTRTSDAEGQLAGAVLQPLADALGARERPVFRVAFVAATAIVFLGSLNVAALVFARLRDRAFELAIRSALGASTAQVIRLILAETAFIAIAGACLGLLTAKTMLDTVLTLMRSEYLLIKTPAVDVRVTLFALAAAVGTLLAFGSWPALRAARGGTLTGVRQQGGTGSSGGRGRRLVLAAQSAIGILVVLAGTLLLTGFVTLWREETGMARANTAIVDVTGRAVQDPARRATLLDDAARISATVPGVVRVAALGGPFLRNAIGGSRYATPSGGHDTVAQDIAVSAGFFDVAGIRLLAGRLPTNEEIEQRRPVAAVSEGLARAYWPGQDPLGQVLSGTRGTATVVGVVNDARIVRLEERQQTEEIYVPMAVLAPQRDRVLLLRVSGDPGDTASRVAAAIRQAIPDLLITRAESVDTALANSAGARRFHSVLFGTFACVALGLLGVGLFGAVAVHTAGRTQEIGIRMALGATAARVRRMVIADTLAPILVGVVAGGMAAWWAMRVMASLIYGVQPHDPRLWAMSVMFVLTTAIAAAWLPARRASRVDPQLLLRGQ